MINDKNVDYYLGIDTSNYKTSVAVVDSFGRIIRNIQEFLDVKKGERGLRQSTALFQHVNRLPDIIADVLSDNKVRSNLVCVSYSSKPRPVEGSYMPVFNVGTSFAKTISAAMDIPSYSFSHQEGHIQALRFYSPLIEKQKFIAFHFSGGTTEALMIDGKRIEKIGGTKDIAFGQVVDRVGVALGMKFPCGQEMDTMLVKGQSKHFSTLKLSKVSCKNGFINLSGIESQCQRLIQRGDVNPDDLIYNLFVELGKTILHMIEDFTTEYGIDDYLLAGGFSSSLFIQNLLTESRPKGINLYYGPSTLASDNAVGIALLGGEYHGLKADNRITIK